ncbi:putative ABC transporter ATP-binding protein [metagenome]|uniref:Putative ABC transporter ATP-binding protein n=1 Tax=metagenome TaxID=256318 RepID=A0A2P2BYP8_9ZZZZ
MTLTHHQHVDVQVRGLGKQYGDRRAVDDVSFDVPAGSVTALLGGNGAGKSTSIRLMLGLSVGEGETLFAGTRLAELGAPQRTVGAFLGSPGFHPNRTARRHLTALCVAYGLPRSRADEVLALTGLADRRSSAPRTFSTGLRQRLGIATALLADPPVLVLDEPTNGLDPQGIRDMRGMLRDHAAAGGTVLMATHVLSEVEFIADRVVIMESGVVVAESPVADIVGPSPDQTLKVTCENPLLLADLVRSAGGSADVAESGELTVHGLTDRVVAGLARDQRILVWAIGRTQRTMEDYFLTQVDRQRFSADHEAGAHHAAL